MARPLLVLIPTTAFLVLLALPVKDLRLGTVDATVVPKSLESRQGFDVLQEEFDLAVSTVIPVAYTLEGDPLAPENIAHLYAFGQAVEELDHVESVSSIVNLSPSFGPEQLQRHVFPSRGGDRCPRVQIVKGYRYARAPCCSLSTVRCTHSLRRLNTLSARYVRSIRDRADRSTSMGARPT